MHHAGITGTVELQFASQVIDRGTPVHLSRHLLPELSKDSAESKDWLASEPSWIDSEISKTSMGGNPGWDMKGTIVHRAQAHRVGELNAACMVALNKARNEVAASALRRNQFFKVLKSPVSNLAKLALPKLDLQSIEPQRSRAQTTRVDWERSEDSYQDSLWSEGAFSDRSLRSVVTDREARRRWLYDTRELSKEHSLESFAVHPKPRVPPKLLVGPQIDKATSEMRGEAKRISKTLHAVNVSLMKKPGSFLTASDVPMPNRTQQLQNLREDLQEMTKSVQSIAFSLGAPTPRPPRFDYIKANMATLENNRHHVIGARRIRQSIEFQDKIESAIVKNTQKQIEKCDDIAVKLRRRERRQHKNQMADLAYALERAQQTWIAASFLVRFTTVCSASLADFREYRMRMVMYIQRFWRLYWQRMGRKKVAALAKITRWVRKHIGSFRVKRKERAIHKVKTYITEMKEVILVLPAIRKFKQRVLVIQRSVRQHIERSRLIRKRLQTHFEKMEKQIIFNLVREKVLKDREVERAGSRGEGIQRTGSAARTSSSTSGRGGGGAGRRRSLSISEENPMDWNKMFDEMYRFRVAQEIKDNVILQLVRRKREAFAHKRKKWKEEMADFRASFRTTTFFRVQIQEFLTNTGQESSLENLERIAGNNQGMARMIRSMNKKLPIHPIFKDAVSDDRMRHLCYQALFKAAKSSYNIRRLMEGVHEPLATRSPPPPSGYPRTGTADVI